MSNRPICSLLKIKVIWAKQSRNSGFSPQILIHSRSQQQRKALLTSNQCKITCTFLQASSLISIRRSSLTNPKTRSSKSHLVKLLLPMRSLQIRQSQLSDNNHHLLNSSRLRMHSNRQQPIHSHRAMHSPWVKAAVIRFPSQCSSNSQAQCHHLAQRQSRRHLHHRRPLLIAS